MFFTDRSESDVFADLATLTSQPGYIHAMAKICHRDNLIAYQGDYSASNLERMFDPDRLIRTEITTLLGLMMRQPLDLNLPTPDRVQELVSRSDKLMEELHQAMSRPMFESIGRQAADAEDKQDFWDGLKMREPIFYAAESAYTFQYRDLFVEKYIRDDDWLRKNKGFTTQQAQLVARTMCSLMDSRATNVIHRGKETETSSESLLAHFEFTPSEISQRAGLDIVIVQAVFDALTFTGQNSQFRELGDFNGVAATPLLPTGRGSVLLFLHYAIYEALYESPFFWMNSDETYKQAASDNRGAFVENFSHKRLAAVFGAANVHSNVNLIDGKNTVGEADVLVIFGDRMIIVQAKAKKLTLAARKGNDGQLKLDFAAAIQKASDQGWECANAILSGKCRMVDHQGREIALPSSIKEIYPFCVVSDHYPALAFQANQYLKYQTTGVIQAPLVMDVFLLDVLAEMLDTPLRLLSYARLRATATGKLMMSHELTALAYHLRQNMWLNPDFNMVALDDSIASDLDAAMTVRREGVRGKRVPPGILTVMQGTLYEHLIIQIEHRADPAILELGFTLLSMSEDSCRNIHDGLSGITALAKKDGMRHDFTIEINSGETGITFHCNPNSDSAAIRALQLHCEKRKYKQGSPMWFGVSLSPEGSLQFGVTLNTPWSKSPEMDELTKDMKAPARISTLVKSLKKSLRPQKCGRNDPCPCGSGKKYKKCCIP
ncbi:SEC-C metal-binding domain-containing protein [Pseudomonas sp. R16(2017)]|uniref:SEC-C metal-binding domain-containing protein n=1 Tax=Pseudomonas sp. R16(2017) TaxID=1981704 RepID=UPI000A1F1DC5